MVKKIFSILAIFLLLFPIISSDGGIFIPGDRDIWRAGMEDNQFIAINYENNIENMLISIQLDNETNGSEAVWIFPIPGSPENIDIDVMRGFPNLHGRDIESRASETLTTSLWLTYGYSLFPLSLSFALLRIFNSAMGSQAGDLGSLNYDSIVYERVEKMGMITELVSAKDPRTFDNYLVDRGANLSTESKAVFMEYFEKDYSFVVSFISDLEKARSTEKSRVRYREYDPLGVFVKFPTDKIYFPLKPTSIYGDQEIPIFIYVMDHVIPQLPAEIEKDTQVTYFNRGYAYNEDNLGDFFNGVEKRGINYTKIKIETSANNFVDDIWMEEGLPRSVKSKILFTNYSFVIMCLLLVIASLLSSWWSGLISFSKYELSRKKIVFWGLWNCLTFIGLLVATFLLKNPDKKEKILISKKVLYLFLFYVFFTALIILFSIILHLII